MTTRNMTAREAAAAWLEAKPAGRKALEAFIDERAKKSARKRWAHIAKHIAEGNTLMIEYYATEGWEARKAILAKAKPATTTAKAKRASRKAAAKPAATNHGAALAAAIAALSPEKQTLMVAFLGALGE